MYVSKECPLISLDIEPFTEGLIELFTEEEKGVLRFGMLPARVMKCVTKSLREKLIKDYRISDPSSETVELWDQKNDKYYVFRLDRVVNELVHEITLQLYRIGDLVV